MVKFLIKRIISIIPVFLILTFAVFVLSDFAPGSAADIVAGSQNLTEEQYEALVHSYGLDRPILVRYGDWLINLLKGDMGMSLVRKTAVSKLIKSRIWQSLLLMLTGLILAILVSIPLGVAAAYKPYKFWDNISSTLAFIGNSMPSFFLGLVVLYIFSAKLGVLPGFGMYSAGTEHTLTDLILHLIMPAFVVAFTMMGNIVKQTRGGMLEVLNEEYIKTARSKGLTQKSVLIKHGLRNALIPIVTVISLQVPRIVGGSVVIEQVFGWPGIGSLMISAIYNRDFNIVMGVTTVICIIVMLSNILLDIVYGILDPRISRGD